LTAIWYQKLPPGLGAAGVVKVAVGEQQVFNLLRIDPAGPDVVQQLRLGATAAGIYQRRVAVEIDEINGGILRGSELAAAHRIDLAGDVHALDLTPG
jgi:hypothetical protein